MVRVICRRKLFVANIMEAKKVGIYVILGTGIAVVYGMQLSLWARWKVE